MNDKAVSTGLSVTDIMTRNPLCVGPGTDAREIALAPAPVADAADAKALLGPVVHLDRRSWLGTGPDNVLGRCKQPWAARPPTG